MSLLGWLAVGNVWQRFVVLGRKRVRAVRLLWETFLGMLALRIADVLHIVPLVFQD